MSSYIEQELEARGVSEVIVVVRRMPEPATLQRVHRALAGAADASRFPDLAPLAARFIRSALSHADQIRRSLIPEVPPTSTRRAAKPAPAHRIPALPAARYYPQLGVMFGAVDATGLAALRRDARVIEVLGAPPLRLIRPRRARPAAEPGRATWGITALRVAALHRQGLTGRGTLVGHLDTGVDAAHPSLRGAVQHFAEFDPLGREVRPAPRPWDSEGHGTHTAGTIAGRRVGRTHVGVAPGAELASAMVIEGGEVVARVLGGMDWAVGLGVRVLSMSLGFTGWWSDFLPLTRILRERGILPVFAAGNEGPGQSRSPGNYPDVLSVGACTRNGHVAEFSSSQRFRRAKDPVVPDVVAPGVGIVSARAGGGYESLDGTSMATAHVAGLAALLLEARPDRTVDQLERAILRSCRLGPGMTAARANRGLPNAVEALKLIMS